MRTLLALWLLAAAPLCVSAQTKLRLELPQDGVDVVARTARFRLSGGVPERVDIEMFSPEGEPLYTGQETFERATAGAPLSVSWPDLGKRGENFRMELKFTAVGGGWITFQVIRFYVEVPHEEVEFDSGKWAIKPDQQLKLDKPLLLLKDAAAKYGKLMNVSLYVAGHTDTVGAASDNQRLSERRAQAIAQWFTQHGLSGLPIYVRGFGEGAPAVKTKDNVAEQRNRRAQYIVSSFPPTLAGPGSWRRIH